MIETKHKIVMNTHVIDIGDNQEYGYVCVSVDNNDLTINFYDKDGKLATQDVHKLQRKLTAEEIAFTKAYLHNVADAKKSVVHEFLMSLHDHDKFCEDYPCEYSGLADAHGMWKDALEFAKQPANCTKKEEEDDNYILIS
jgi:hypothetical protein